MVTFLQKKQEIGRKKGRRKEGRKERKKERTLAGVAQWIEHWPVNQRVPGLLARSPVGGAQEATTH